MTDLRGMDYQRAAERLEASIDRTTTPDGCHPWTGNLTSGYGYVRVPGSRTSTSAHRLVYMLRNGLDELPATIVIRHTCDNRACCRGDHLIAGSPADNSRDMVERGRHRSAFVGVTAEERERNRRRLLASRAEAVVPAAPPAAYIAAEERRRLYGA